MTHENRAGDYLEHLLVACNRASVSFRGVAKQQFLDEFMIHDVAIRAITVAGEAAKRIRVKSPKLVEEHDCMPSWN